MTFARRLAHVENIPQQDSAERAFNKLTRTFAAQMAALKEYRSKGEQRVIVQHVNVSDGGRAIVGNVSAPAGVGAKEKAKEQPHALFFRTRNARVRARGNALLQNGQSPSGRRSAAVGATFTDLALRA
jgi:hypothetical protein